MKNVIVTLEEAKAHMIVEHALDDLLIQSYIDAASEYVAKRLNRSMAEILAAEESAVKLLVLQQVADFYANRESASATELKTSKTFEYLLSMYRNYSDVSGL